MNHILGLPAEIADAILATTLSCVSHPRGHYRQLETLRLVCRLWDITILNTAAFWSIIHLDQPIDMTTRCLERSRGYPLDIYGSNWSAYLDLIEPMPEPLAEELLHHAHRIRLLDVCIDRDHPRLGHLLTNPMPALESLTVKRHPYSRASSAINLQSSVRLHSLRLHCIDLDPRALDAVHGLRHLALSVPSSFQDTLDIVSRYPQLQILEIRSPLHAHAGDILQQETIHLPLLDALDLTNLSTNDAFQIINKFVVRRGCRINVATDVQRSRSASAAAGWAQLVASAFATTSNNSLVVMKMTESTLQLRLGPVEVKLTSLVAPEAEGKQIFRALEAALSGREILLHLSQFPVWCPAPRTFPGIIGQLSLDVRGLIIEGEEGVRESVQETTISLLSMATAYRRSNGGWLVGHLFPDLQSLEIRATNPSHSHDHPQRDGLPDCIARRNRMRTQAGETLGPAASIKSLRLVGPLGCTPELLVRLRALIPEVIVKNCTYFYFGVL